MARPRVGLAAGLVVLLLVALARIGNVANPRAKAVWSDWRSVLAQDRGSALAPIVGVVLLCSSILTRLAERAARAR